MTTSLQIVFLTCFTRHPISFLLAISHLLFRLTPLTPRVPVWDPRSSVAEFPQDVVANNLSRLGGNISTQGQGASLGVEI